MLMQRLSLQKSDLLSNFLALSMREESALFESPPLSIMLKFSSLVPPPQSPSEAERERERERER